MHNLYLDFFLFLMVVQLIFKIGQFNELLDISLMIGLECSDFGN